MHKCIIGVVMQEGRFGTPIGGTILRETLGPTVTKKKKKRNLHRFRYIKKKYNCNNFL